MSKISNIRDCARAAIFSVHRQHAEFIAAAKIQITISFHVQTTSLLSHLVTNRRLRLFGHIARSSPREDHHRALAACIRHGQVPPDWKRPAGRPSHNWLRAIDADPLNSGLATAWRKATTRDEWRHIVDTATLQRSTL